MSIYDKLTAIMLSNPDLLFNNDGYENLHPNIVERNKPAIKQVEEILSSCVKGFVRFQNFKPRKDGTIAVRYQVHYNDEGSFTGVAYTPLDWFKEWESSQCLNSE